MSGLIPVTSKANTKSAASSSFANTVLVGDDTLNVLTGGAGDDILMPGRTTAPTGCSDVVDGGSGIDTVSFEWLTTGVYVNLTAGVATDLIPVTHGTAVSAFLYSIENATGGHGNDILLGNASANTLAGGGGNDQLYGLAGNDTLLGQDGNDILRGDEGCDIINGGAGIDRADYYNSNAAVTINLSAGTGVGGHAHGDVLIDIENVYGSSFNDVLIGNGVANTLYGNSGNDQLYGLSGNDFLYGQDGNDVLRGDEGCDVIDGGAGIDRADYYNSNAGVVINLMTGTGYYGHAQGDTFYNVENLYGSAFNDVLAGNAEANTLYGYTGNDTLSGLDGNDYLEGQAGNDSVYGGNGHDVLGGGDGNDNLFGESGNDILYGGNGNDCLTGGDGDDVLWGDAGDDQVFGGTGNDFAVLGLGNDAFTMGAGDDRLRFDYGNGTDTIFDFGNGNDVIDFSNTDMTLAVLQANAVYAAAGVLLQLGSGSVLLAGLDLQQIDWANDFVFAV